MSKHTQGGWRLQKDFVVFDEDGQCAQVCGHNKEANARLIAAAPELLSALVEFAMECGPDTGKTQRPSIHPLVLRRALAAIAKATGDE